MRKYPKTEAQKAQAREYAKRRYWEDPEKFRAENSEYGKRKRAENRAAGIKSKPRVYSDADKARHAERQQQKYWEDPGKYRARASEQGRVFRQTNPDVLKQRRRAYYFRHREEILERERVRREAGREEIRAAARARIDPVENRARVKAWQRANPGKVREAKLRRRALEVAAPVIDFTDEQWQELLAEFNGICAYCPAPATTRDHMTPLSRGGSHSSVNIVPACLRCNSRKGTRTLLEFLEMGAA